MAEQTAVATVREERYLPRPYTAGTMLTLGEMKTFANYAAESGLFKNARTAAAAFIKMAAGQELGMSAISAITNLHVVEGRVTMDATFVRLRIRNSERYDYRVISATDEAAELEILDKKSGTPLGREKFTVADAERAGLWNKPGPWKQYPKNMLLSRATANAARTYCPDVFGGPVYTPDELGAIVDMNEAGEVIGVHASGSPEAAPPAAIRDVTPPAATNGHVVPPTRKDLLKEVYALNGYLKSIVNGAEMLAITKDIAAVLEFENTKSVRDCADDELAEYLRRKTGNVDSRPQDASQPVSGPETHAPAEADAPTGLAGAESPSVAQGELLPSGEPGPLTRGQLDTIEAIIAERQLLATQVVALTRRACRSAQHGNYTALNEAEAEMLIEALSQAGKQAV